MKLSCTFYQSCKNIRDVYVIRVVCGISVYKASWWPFTAETCSRFVYVLVFGLGHVIKSVYIIDCYVVQCSEFVIKIRSTLSGQFMVQSMYQTF